MVVCGPTASGKSGVVDRLAGEIEAPSIVVDSMQVYRELPVVTNQHRVRPAELAGVASVAEEWTVARHKAAAEEVIQSAKGPFVLDAGTGMYLNAIILDVSLAPKVSEEIRAEAERRAGAEENLRREARRIELEMTGAGERNSIWEGELRYVTSLLYIRPPREELDRRIAERSEHIARHGADEVAEVLRRWRDLGLEPNDSVKRSVGFQEMAAYVNGEVSLEWAEEKISTRTRRLARRQMRWFDKLYKTLPEEAETVVAEDPKGKKVTSYMSGIIDTWE